MKKYKARFDLTTKQPFVTPTTYHKTIYIEEDTFNLARRKVRLDYPNAKNVKVTEV